MQEMHAKRDRFGGGFVSPYLFSGAGRPRFLAHMYYDVHIDTLWEALRTTAPSSEKSTNACDVQVTDEDLLSSCVGHERANLNQLCRQQDRLVNFASEHRCTMSVSLQWECNLHFEFFQRGVAGEMRPPRIFFLTIFRPRCVVVDSCSWCLRERLLPCFRRRLWAQIDCWNFRQEADPHALSRKHFYCQRRTFPLHDFFPFLFLRFKPAESTSLLSTSWSVTLTSAWIHTLLSCCQVAPPCPQKLVSAWRWNRRSCLHPRRRSKCLLHQRYNTRCWLQGLFFLRCWSRGRVRWIWLDHRFDVPHFV